MDECKNDWLNKPILNPKMTSCNFNEIGESWSAKSVPGKKKISKCESPTDFDGQVRGFTRLIGRNICKLNCHPSVIKVCFDTTRRVLMAIIF